MKANLKSRIALVLALVLALASLAVSASAETEVIIGTGNAYNPYCYLDENNELTGFELALLKKIDEKLTDYTFTYQALDFDNILLSLESGKIDVAAHQFEYNIERDQKYLYGTVGYTTYELYLVTRDDDDSISSFADLKGKVLLSTSTTNNAYYIANKWNEENGNIFEIAFSSTTPLLLEDLANGVGDAFISVARNVAKYQEEYGAKIKLVGEPVSDSNTYYLFNKQNGAELQKVFDQALSELLADGTVSALSLEWLGADYTPKQ